MFVRVSVVAAAAAFLLTASCAAADPVGLQKGDRVVFLGDSITQAAVGKSGYITQLKATLTEKHGVELVGAGISGNKVPDIQKRLDKDVLAKKPSVVVVYIGINDVWHGENDPSRGTSKERFDEGLRDVVGRIKASGARVVLCTPTVIGEKKAGGNKLDARLDEYAGISRKVAADTGSKLCDLRKAFVDHLAKNNPDNKASGVLTTDAVHLNEAGNRLVAETILGVLTK
ncbi:SGNH/GDSL hydrolase family protein [Urbifossiella limnaea]|uniref:Acetylxylan esterase n=1 Tax=Urbifossiella limnaea TaxID=2528023 RepID=A0A517XXV6_9BACT|nr:SGNH/GDSL hydrolase family protein [Urbifossiella limnaea]QDU22325.1 Acetylxylan esterase precursor [Urbifossiella limnaea]